MSIVRKESVCKVMLTLYLRFIRWLSLKCWSHSAHCKDFYAQINHLCTKWGLQQLNWPLIMILQMHCMFPNESLVAVMDNCLPTGNKRFKHMEQNLKSCKEEESKKWNRTNIRSSSVLSIIIFTTGSQQSDISQSVCVFVCVMFTDSVLAPSVGEAGLNKWSGGCDKFTSFQFTCI